MKYKNKFYIKNNIESREYYENDNGIEYKGFLIFKHTKDNFHIVDHQREEPLCIGMYAGINGAKGKIDEIEAHCRRTPCSVCCRDLRYCLAKDYQQKEANP